MTREEPHELGAIAEVTRVSFIHNSVRHTARTLLYAIPLAYLNSKIEPKRSVHDICMELWCRTSNLTFGEKADIPGI